jgi:hypothetical protein
MRRRTLALMLLVTVAPLASADVVDIKWSDQGHFFHKGTIAAGKLVEVCGKLSAGRKIRWDFEVSTPVDFNVHYHEGKDVIFPAKLSAVSKASDTLVTKVPQDYCWMWTNQTTAPASFSVNLQQ